MTEITADTASSPPSWSAPPGPLAWFKTGPAPGLSGRAAFKMTAIVFFGVALYVTASTWALNTYLPEDAWDEAWKAANEIAAFAFLTVALFFLLRRGITAIVSARNEAADVIENMPNAFFALDDKH